MACRSVRSWRHHLKFVATVAGETSQAALWLEADKQSSSAPERLLLDAIAAGELDEHLVALADAVHARRALLHTVRSATAIAELCVGDPVRINRNVRPGYLYGEHGVIIDLDDHTVTVRLLRPVGRFRTGELRCPPLALDKLDRTPGSPQPDPIIGTDRTDPSCRFSIKWGAPNVCWRNARRRLGIVEDPRIRLAARRTETEAWLATHELVGRSLGDSRETLRVRASFSEPSLTTGQQLRWL